MPPWYITHMDKEQKMEEVRRLLRGACDDDLVELDARNRLSLGPRTTHKRYLITDLGEGMILLTPVLVFAADDPIVQKIKMAQERRARSE